MKGQKFGFQLHLFNYRIDSTEVIYIRTQTRHGESPASLHANARSGQLQLAGPSRSQPETRAKSKCKGTG